MRSPTISDVLARLALSAGVIAAATLATAARARSLQPPAPPEPVDPLVAPEPSLGIPAFQPPDRIDLAWAFLRFEDALALAPLADTPSPGAPSRRLVHQVFDDITVRFFRGEFSDAIAMLDDLVWRLRRVTPSPAQRLAGALSVRVEPRILAMQAGQSPTLTVRVAPMFPLRPLDAPAGLRVIARDAAGVVAWEAPFAWPAGAPAPGFGEQSFTLPASTPDGAYRVLILPDGDDQPITLGWFAKRDEPLRAVREQLEARLVAADARLTQARAAGRPNPALAQAIDIARGRAALLADEPEGLQSGEFLFNPADLAAQLARETDAIDAGANPYHRRTGDHWRQMVLAGVETPMRVYAPAALATIDSPRPLVIALHGAGGDEHLFMDAYGRGTLRRLADEHGFLAVSALTQNLGVRDEALADLINGLTLDYPLDPQRVYVLGHSMGAGAAAILSNLPSGRVAAGASLAGGPQRFVPGRRTPLLVIGAEFDPIIRAHRLEAAARAAIAAGEPVEYRTAPGAGHTLVVGEELPTAVAWLLNHHLPPKPAPAPATPAEPNP